MRNIIFLLLLPISLVAQKEDYQWIFGYQANTTTENFGTTLLDFNKDSLQVWQRYSEMNFTQTNSSICNESGQLLFYTNGIYIANNTHQPMRNGMGLNPIDLTDDYAEYGLNLSQGAVILQNPANINQYYLIHAAMDYPIFSENNDSITVFYYTPFLYYTIVEPNHNGGLGNRGRVVEKNMVMKQDTLELDNLISVRHANGRDWWIMIAEYGKGNYYKFLLDPKGITEYPAQQIGIPTKGGIVGQSVFSPNGEKYVRYNLFDVDLGSFVHIYDFDRCSGELSNHLRIRIDDRAYAAGAAISPNSRYLYISSDNYVYQFDLEAPDIEASKDTVAIYDGFFTAGDSIFATKFFLAQLAPDGKIYINSPGSKDYLHVIHHPDSTGVACNLEQHGIKLPTYNSSSLPIFPNYRLGKLENSPCDTIRPISTTATLEDRAKITTYPNPVHSQLTVDLTLADYTNLNQFQLELTNLYGQVIEQRTLRAYSPIYRFEVGDLPRGVYFINLYQQGEFVISKKVVLH